MAILKCKMCGGDLNLIEGAITAECDYCGSVQTVPKVDDEKKLTLFARANRLRAACEFDKAAGIYEAIVADFPEEAEAYWGLVLCKYGIEYVDDPGTDKKIPTCHRSSFDSVMEDSDFEQTLENADPIARKIYRDEAKQLEEIRKSIIAVSSNEQPYDIFICYKETDEHGDRTLDSALAQDIYDALTAKDYRVFFARITLEDKLGMEYEPYIFAALNSAKIMLAVGTDYEYYNAVWVKNEWSRYLKLMAKDKDKHLIPCYKGIDAYDMPKEFSKLQAQDLGKVGAMQDLLRGIEKILPKQKSATVIQERVVVGNSGDNKIASLLDRGNMALEDGDWDKADSFFEDVLNNDSKNAQAYLGKTLVVEKCRTLDALIRKLKDAYQHTESKQLYLQEDNDHIDVSVQKHAIEGYVDKDKIRKFYEFDLSYSSTVESRKQQCKDAETWWKNHKWLSRAEKFAAGESAQILQQARIDLFSALNARIAKAEQAELEAYNKKLEQYQAHLKQADEDARELFTSGSYARQMDYEIACGEVEKSMDLKVLNRATDTLRRLSGYKDSDTKYEEGLKKIGEITVHQQEAEAAKKEQQEKEAEIARKKKEKEDSIGAIILLLLILAAVAGIAYAIYHFAWAKPKEKYDTAVMYYETGKYQEAITLFSELKNFKDSEDKLPEAKYAYAGELLANGNKVAAFNGYRELLPYMDCKEIIYTIAEEFKTAGDNVHAAMCYGTLGDYKDSREASFALWDDIAERDTISALMYTTVGLKSDGTVVAAGRYSSGGYDIAPEVAGWSDIIAVSMGEKFAVGLKADGTVVAAGENYSKQCNVSGWSDVVAISASAKHTVGLKSDGTVVATGMKSLGRCDVSEWTDIVAISTAFTYTVGLKSDGTVVMAGDPSDNGQYNFSEWTDIVAIRSNRWHTMGLKADGTVVLAGATEYFNPEVTKLSNIVAISAGYWHLVAQDANGKMIAIGNEEYNEYSQSDVSEWSGIVAFTAGDFHTVGLKRDGTIVFTGRSLEGQGGCKNWSGIKIPE